MENEFIEENGFFEYSKWFLAVNDEYREESRRHYEFPYGDFQMSIDAASSPPKAELASPKNFDVENAAADLLAVIDKQARE